MSENEPIKFSMQELTKILVKEKGLTEGRWMISAEFGIKGINAGPNEQNVSPAALVPLLSIGIIPAPDDLNNNLVVDAAELA